MKKKIKVFLASVLMVLGLSIVAMPAFADNTSICDINNDSVSQAARDAAGCGNSVASLTNVVQEILNIIIGVLGLVAVIIIVMGGITYMTSGGESTKIEKAKKTILGAVIGLIICALSFAIVNFTIKIIKDSQNNSEVTTSGS